LAAAGGDSDLGIASFAQVPPLQMCVMEAAKDAPNFLSEKGADLFIGIVCLLLAQAV